MSIPYDRHDPQRGIALLSALLAMVVVSATAAVMFTTAQSEAQSSRTHRLSTEVLHLAEAGTIAAEQQLLVAVANTLPPPVKGVVAVGDEEVSFVLRKVGKDGYETDADGVRTLHTHYVIEATAEVEGFRKTVHRVVDVGLTPIFQYAIFYGQDLELLPGPSMTLSGRVHSNGDLYVGVGGSGTLSIDSNYFRSTGKILRHRKNNDSRTGGQIRIRDRASGLFQEMWGRDGLANQGVPSSSGYDSDFFGYDANADGDLDDTGDWADFAVGALDRWGGSVQTGAHGMRRVEPPSIGSIKRFEPVGDGQGDWNWDGNTDSWIPVGDGNGDHRRGRYHDSADLVILDGRAYDSAGQPLMLPPGVITEKSMYDAREKTTVKVTEIDMAQLKSAGAFPANGLIYAARSDSTVHQPHGIRLAKGAELAAPLTVASENPVYIQGDYNVVNKKPASVISDAVNLLSNSWNDSKTAGSLPKAMSTTYNCAMITGANETEGSSYSGGFENLPRFHENWSSTACNISGSFVNIYTSDFAQDKWAYGGDRYQAPQRNWDYDKAFNDPSQLPPFTPNVAQVKSSGWWE